MHKDIILKNERTGEQMTTRQYIKDKHDPTQEQFDKMNYKDRLKLFHNDPELYNALSQRR